MFGTEIGKWARGLRGRLLVILGLPVILLAVVITVSLSGISSQESDIKKLVDVRLPVTSAIGQMMANMHALPRFLWVAYAHDGTENVEKRKRFLTQARDASAGFNQALDAYLALPIIQQARDNMMPVVGEWKEVSAASVDAIALLEKNTAQADREARELIMAKIVARVVRVGDMLKAADAIANEFNKKIAVEASDNSKKVKSIVLISSAVGLAVFILLGLLTASRLAKNLGAITQEISTAASQTAMASDQLSGASQQLSSGATEAAASLEETASSLEKLSGMVKRNTENAKEASGLSRTSREAAEQGESEIRTLITAMNDMAHSSKKIEEIINVIDDIAFQTNLLALNAAVEAARAGEQGRGFAVVAEAVRNLAQRSAGAAKEITSLIKDTVAKAERGSKMADGSGAALKGIVTAVQKVAALNNEIARASEEQATGLDQINRAMGQLDVSTQGNAASAEEVAASSEEMSSQAQALHHHVAGLVTVIEGAADQQKLQLTQSQRFDRRPTALQRPAHQPHTQSRSSFEDKAA